jgi:hypothetical protein
LTAPARRQYRAVQQGAVKKCQASIIDPVAVQVPVLWSYSLAESGSSVSKPPVTNTLPSGSDAVVAGHDDADPGHVFVVQANVGRERQLIARRHRRDERRGLLHRGARHDRHITWMHRGEQAIQPRRDEDGR